MVIQSKSFCFTLNNYTDDDIVRLSKLFEDGSVDYMIYGKEVGESGTPHLQGYVRFPKKKRIKGVKNLIGEECHVEATRNVEAAINYCKKDNDFTEFGELENNQGNRSDIQAVKEDIQAGFFDLDYYMENHSEFYCKNKNFIMEYINLHLPVAALKPEPLRRWQGELWLKLQLEPDTRKINFYIDYTGNSGKSWFARYYQELHPQVSQIMNFGKLGDMCHGYNVRNRVLFMDVPRQRVEYFSYEFLEMVKDGRFFSGKYNSTNKKFNPPHIVVFMNVDPSQTAFSSDRYETVIITKEMCNVPDEPIVLTNI